MAPSWELPGGDRDKGPSIEVLAFRVDTLTREKEELEERIARMERYVQSGKGFMLSITIIGAALGFAATYWKSIFGPWMGKP